MLEIPALVELKAALVELVLPVVELEVEAGEKLVGMFTEPTPGTVKTPVEIPVVEPVGIIDPANGTKLPFCIVPPIGVVDPVGVNVATVPLGIVLPVNVIVDISVPPTVPVIGVVGAVPRL